MKYKINPQKCTECSLCIGKCEKQAISNESSMTTDDSLCNVCGKCVQECPFEAIQMEIEEIPVSEQNDAIPEHIRPFESILRASLSGAAAVGPLGAFGPWDTAAVGAVWLSTYFAIQEKSKYKLANDRQFVSAVVVGAAQYIVGSKVATWLFHLIPGAGTVMAMGISSATNVYFTYRFAEVVILLLNEDNSYTLSDKQLAERALKLLCKWPSFKEVRTIFKIYNLNFNPDCVKASQTGATSEWINRQNRRLNTESYI